MFVLLILAAFAVGVLVAVLPVDPPRETPWSSRSSTLSRLMGLAVVAELAQYVLEAVARWLEHQHPFVAQLLRTVKTVLWIVEWVMRVIAAYGVGGLVGAWWRSSRRP